MTYDIVAIGGQVQIAVRPELSYGCIVETMHPSAANQMATWLRLAARKAEAFDRKKALRDRQKELQQEITKIQMELATLEDQP